MKAPDPDPQPTDADALPADDTGYIIGVLSGLLGLASKLVGMVHQRALAEPEALVSGSFAFERIARCIRRLAMLLHRLPAAPPPTAPPRRAPRQREAATPREAERHERLEKLEVEELEKLEMEELEEDEFAEDIGQPVAVIIADICREMGLGDEWRSHPWERCTPEDLAALCAYAARPDPACQDPPPKASHDAPWVAPLLSWAGRSPPASPAGAGPEPPS